MFMGIPELRIIAPSQVHDIGALIKTAVLDDEYPVLFIENKTLYPRLLELPVDGCIGDFSARIDDSLYPTVVLSNNNFEEAEVTVVVYGGIVPMVMEASMELLFDEEIFVEIVIPAMIKPFPERPVFGSAERTKRVVIVEEGTKYMGWGAELAAQINEKLFGKMKLPVRRVGALDLPLGSSQVLEKKILPSKDVVKQAIKEVAGGF